MTKPLWVALLLAAGLVHARPAKPPAMEHATLTEGFLAAHPDLRWRLEGVRFYEKEDYPAAMRSFLRAAGFADKPSQAIIAEMHWKGVGTPRDRPLAYAWMDIAAERLYPDLVAHREAYWEALTAAEREEAVRRGQAMLAEYGDAAAQPRLERILKRERRQVTGSRVGAVGNLKIIPNTGPLAGTGMTIAGHEYYADKYWKPSHYWAHQDALWNAPRRGQVVVGDVEKAAPVPAKETTPERND